MRGSSGKAPPGKKGGNPCWPAIDRPRAQHLFDFAALFLRLYKHLRDRLISFNILPFANNATLKIK